MMDAHDQWEKLGYLMVLGWLIHFVVQPLVNGQFLLAAINGGGFLIWNIIGYGRGMVIGWLCAVVAAAVLL